jgi:coenzyme F420-reducing hydrogenase delta subunit
MALPMSVRHLRVLCMGCINQDRILKAFKHGGGGVILLECEDVGYRYGPGPEVGYTNVDRVHLLSHFLSINQE